MKYYLLFVVVALLLVPPAMPVCNVPSPRLVCAEYFASSAVVEATLVRTTAIPEKDDPEGAVAAHVYYLRVNRTLRGEIGENIRVYVRNDSARTTFDWVVKRQYLLFLFYSSHDKALKVDGCGNSGPLDQAQAALKEIDLIKTRHNDGMIHGVVRAQAGVRVEARGMGGLYTARTNEKGEFQIRVPAGQYTVHAVARGFRFETADFGYENPRKIQIEPGGCAQVQLDGFEHSISPTPRKH
jgi:hypothetical protein